MELRLFSREKEGAPNSHCLTLEGAEWANRVRNSIGATFKTISEASGIGYTVISRFHTYNIACDKPYYTTKDNAQKIFEELKKVEESGFGYLEKNTESVPVRINKTEDDIFKNYDLLAKKLSLNDLDEIAQRMGFYCDFRRINK